MKRRISWVAAALVLSGCVSTQTSTSAQIRYQPQWQASGVAHAQPITSNWWQTLGDPTLTQLIELASAQNYDYRIAQLKLAQARAASGLITADRLPQISGQTQAVKRKSSQNGAGGLAELADLGLAPLRQNVYNAGLDASYEIDLFGTRRADQDAANAQTLQAYYASGAVALSVYAEVAQSYINYRAAQAKLALVDQQLEHFSQLADMESQLSQIGESDALKVSRAQQRVSEQQSMRAEHLIGMRQEQYRLSLLTGEAPENLAVDLGAEGTKAALPKLPQSVALGLRSELLQRRPDLQAAKAALQLESAQVAQAVSQLYPKFVLSAQGGFESTVFSTLTNASSSQWALAGIVQIPIFSQGRIRTQIKVQKLKTKQALLEYEQALLGALSEAQTTLSAYTQTAQAAKDLQQAAKLSNQQTRLNQDLLASGSISRKQALSSSISSLNSDEQALSAQARALTQLIALYKALGGGWTPSELAPADQSPP